MRFGKNEEGPTTEKGTGMKRYFESAGGGLRIVLAFALAFSLMLVFPSTASAKNDANADLTLTSTTPSVKSGTTGVLQLDVKVAGSQESIQESYGSAATLVVQLPKDTAAYYDLQTPLADLAINGVQPTYDQQARTLTYKLPNLQTGLSARLHIGLLTKNGITPNNTSIVATATLKSESGTVLAESAEAKIAITSAFQPTITKAFSKVVSSDPSQTVAKPGEEVVWSIKGSVTLADTAGQYIKPGSIITITDKLDSRLTFSDATVSGADLIDRTVNGDTVTWTFKAPSLEAQKAAGTTLFACEIQLTTGTDASISAYTKVPNNVTISAVSIEDQTKTAAGKAEALIAPGGNDVPLPEGNIVVPYTVGPVNGNGNVSNGNNENHPNPNPVVADDAMVRFQDTYFTGISGDEKLFDSTGNPVDRSLWNQNNSILKDGYKKLVNEYTYDDALQFRAVTIYTPHIYYEYNLGRLPLPVLPKTTLTVTLKDGSTRSHVVDWNKTANKVTGNVQVTIYDTGLTDTDEITSYSITYEMEDGSKLNGRLALQNEPLFDIKDGARGTFKWGVTFVPTLADGTTYRRTSTEVTDLVGPRQVTVGEKPVSNPIVLATVEFMKKDGNVVAVGDNQVHVRMFNNTNSNDNLDKQISSTVLLPYGVKVKSDPNASYKIDSLRFGRQQYATPGHFSILDENYNGTGQQLVHIDWDQTTLLPWQRADAYFDVEITKNSPDQLPLTMWGTSSADDVLTAANSSNKVETDADDIDHDGATDQDRIKVEKSYVKYSDNDLRIKKYVKGALDDEFSLFGRTLPGGGIDYKIYMTNTTGNDIFRMGFIDVLPSVGDKGIVDNSDRGSAFTPVMTGAITLPADWSDKVDVYYSASKNPKRDDLYSTVNYSTGAYQHENPADAADPEWKLASEVTDWSAIHSFKLQLKDGVTWLKGQDIEFTFHMKAPELGELDDASVVFSELPDTRTEENELKAAWNSFAMTTNGLLPTEPERVGVVIADPKVDVSGKKTWNDNENSDGIRPGSITVNLMRDGVKVSSQEVKPAADGSWTYKFADLPKYDAADGHAYVYSVAEEAVEGYESSVEGYDIVNTHKPKTPDPDDPTPPVPPVPDDPTPPAPSVPDDPQPVPPAPAGEKPLAKVTVMPKTGETVAWAVGAIALSAGAGLLGAFALRRKKGDRAL